MASLFFMGQNIIWHSKASWTVAEDSIISSIIMEVKVLELKEMWHLGSLYEDMTMDELHGFQWPWITEAAALILFGGEKNKQQLKTATLKAGQSITNEEIHSLVMFRRSRLQAVFNNDSSLSLYNNFFQPLE